MKCIKTPLPGVLLIELEVYGDERGFFLESYHQKKYADAGIECSFVQDNISKSQKGTLRGLHAQLTHPQAKLLHVISGEIWDVAVDLRPDSPTYKKWYGVTLNSQKPTQIYVPVGFGHGFCVLSESAEVHYKCSDLYDPSHALHLLWDDVEVGVKWPISSPILSTKDKNGVTLRACEAELRRCFNLSKSK